LTAFASASSGDSPHVTLTVCRTGCEFSQIAPAIGTAKSGDTIRIASGTYTGGFTIDASIELLGAGAGVTIIRGGGPVVTIGSAGAFVSIDGVTITGGTTRSSPESKPMTGDVGVIAGGGGVEISAGATVSISNSAITDNRVAPIRTAADGPSCPRGPCPYAQAAGGGIENSGKLTLTNTTVSDNRVGSIAGLSTLASDADGGGIEDLAGSLTIVKSTINGNQASATPPNGRFANAGAIDAAAGVVTISDSSVMHNSASLVASWPDSVQTSAVAGGIHIEAGVSFATISNTKIIDNSVSMTNTTGSTTAFSGGLHTDGVFTLSNDVIADNTVHSAALGSTGNAEGDSGAGEMGGTIRDTHFTGNTVTVSSAHGDASASAGAVIFTGTLTNSTVSDNHVSASSSNGTATLIAGGLQSGGPLTLRHTSVSGNTAKATGHSGTAQGGGIFAALVPNGPPPGRLTLVDSTVTNNVLSGGPHITVLGGGLFANFKLTLTNSSISGNTPDDCSGKSCGGAT
jgi:hypothetical protein